jgi:SAM-dependent methyltransferase
MAPAEPADPADPRTPERIRWHYQVERELADRLRHAPAGSRRNLYPQVYEEMYQRVPDHPQLLRKKSADETRHMVSLQMRFLAHFLRPGITFLEVGAGDCELSVAVARTARKVYAVDVSESVVARASKPDNVEIVLSDGVSIPVPPGSVDLAFSNQLMEHLHPEDAFEQLRNIARALAPGGQYVCITPNRLTGPHDVSRHFDREATGFHMKEYTTRELAAAFRAAGFASATPYLQVKGRTAALPPAMVDALEGALGTLPFGIRRGLASARPWRWMLGIQMVGRRL